MAYVFNPFTGKLDDVGAGGAPTTDASLLTSGTLSDSRLSENVSLDNQNNNFSASQTFAGSANTMPNQTAASDSSIMTRGILGRESFFAPRPQQVPFILATTGSSGSSVSTANSVLTLYSGTSTSADTFSRGVFGLPISNSENKTLLYFEANLVLRRNNGLRVILGGGSTPNADVPSVRCWGVDFTGPATGDDTAVRAQLWYNDNASTSAPTYFSSPIATGTNYGFISRFMIYSGPNSSGVGRSLALFFAQRTGDRISTTPLIVWNHNILITPSSNNVSFVMFAKANVYATSASATMYGEVAVINSENPLLP